MDTADVEARAGAVLLTEAVAANVAQRRGLPELEVFKALRDVHDLRVIGQAVLAVRVGAALAGQEEAPGSACLAVTANAGVMGAREDLHAEHLLSGPAEAVGVVGGGAVVAQEELASLPAVLAVGRVGELHEPLLALLLLWGRGGRPCRQLLLVPDAALGDHVAVDDHRGAAALPLGPAGLPLLRKVLHACAPVLAVVGAVEKVRRQRCLLHAALNKLRSRQLGTLQAQRGRRLPFLADLNLVLLPGARAVDDGVELLVRGHPALVSLEDPVRAKLDGGQHLRHAEAGALLGCGRGAPLIPVDHLVEEQLLVCA
mmetsp:Transcript_15446/g.43215  ORF Transcript_15446/g.43215 Transcript_15446/m.43215 type:complete len:314 (-) Transcript_15446:2281-3222(-)